jgi:hypothetical protein
LHKMHACMLCVLRGGCHCALGPALHSGVAALAPPRVMHCAAPVRCCCTGGQPLGGV